MPRSTTPYKQRKLKAQKQVQFTKQARRTVKRQTLPPQEQKSWATVEKGKMVRRSYRTDGKRHFKSFNRLRQEVYVSQVFQQYGKTVLFGLKDTELDVMMKEIEEIKKIIGEKRNV